MIVELETTAPRGPWVVLDVDSGRAKVGRRLPSISGALLAADGPALLATSGGVIEVDLGGPSIVRELREGVGRGRDAAETDLIRLNGRHVLLGAVGKLTARIVDMDRWAVTRSRLPVSPPWAPLGSAPTRIWSLHARELVTLDDSLEVVDRTPAPPALAAVATPPAVFALVGQLQPHRGTGLLHAAGRDLLPSRLQGRLSGPLDDVGLGKLDPQTLEVKTRRGLGGLARVVEGALGTVLSDRERWTTAMLHRHFTTDSTGRPVLLADNYLVVLDHDTLEPVIEAQLSDDPSVRNWVSRNGLSRAVAVTHDALHIADW